jgi:hypothetical protein
MRLLKKLLLVLTPMGAAAFVAGGGTFGTFSDLAGWRIPPKDAAEAHDPLWRTKKMLLAVMLLGVAAYLGLGGTFASFSAETSNNGSSISSGTLVLGDAVNGTACFSYNAATADNVNAGCNAAFAATTVAPGTFQSTQLAKIDVSNGGSIDGQNLYLFASQLNGKLSSLTTNGSGQVTALVIAAPGMEGTVGASDSITVSDAGHSQTFAVNGTAPTPASNSNGGATTIAVTPQAPNYSYPVNSTVQDTSGNTAVTNTDCYDTKLAGDASWNFNSITNSSWTQQTFNPFCGSLVMWIQEVTSTGKYYCWWGDGSQYSTGSTTFGVENANGLCISSPYGTTSGISGNGVTSIPISTPGGLIGNVTSGDQIVVSQGANTQTFTASGATSAGATSVAIISANVGTTFTSGASVADTTASTGLDSNYTSDTMSNFDIGHHWAGGKLELYPVQSNGTLNTATGHVDLPAGTTRTFYVGVYLPKQSGKVQNPLQGLTSTFGLSWHLDQSSS